MVAFWRDTLENSQQYESGSIFLEEQPPLVISNPPDTQELDPPASFLAREIIETIILTLLIFWMVNAVTGRFRIEGQSMEPTLHEGQYVLINKLSYLLAEPQRGDIIVLEFPNDPSKDFIKRVVAVSGDHIEINNGQVRINGVLLDEPYIKAAPTYSDDQIVPDGQYYVLGDNRNNSHDSHSWSFLPRDEIVGKAWLIYWNIDDWGFVPHYAHPLS